MIFPLHDLPLRLLLRERHCKMVGSCLKHLAAVYPKRMQEAKGQRTQSRWKLYRGFFAAFLVEEKKMSLKGRPRISLCWITTTPYLLYSGKKWSWRRDPYLYTLLWLLAIAWAWYCTHTTWWMCGKRVLKWKCYSVFYDCRRLLFFLCTSESTSLEKIIEQLICVLHLKLNELS